MKANNFKPTLVLGCICLASALLLSVINMFTAPIIADRQQAAANDALLEVLPGGSGFDEILDVSKLPDGVDKAWSADKGYVFQITYSGYKSGNTVMVGVDSDGKIVNTKLINFTDTYKQYESKLSGEWNTDNETTIKDSLRDTFDIAASATSASLDGFTAAMRTAIHAYKILGGEEVDTRTPEQILQDNCKAALGTSERNFIQWYASTDSLGDAKIYINDKGVVISSGEHFVGYLYGSNTPFGEPSAEALAATASAYAVYASATRIALADYQGIGSAVKYAYKLADDSYLLRLERKGYKYAKSPMIIELVIDKDGKIASCVTVAHSESAGYGSPCGTPEYYEQYNGKDSTNYTDIPNIEAERPIDGAAFGGATQTSNGYKDAIRQGFSAFEQFTAQGGN